MQIPIYQADAFASAPFRGNPAAVCPLEAPIPDALQQSIALENQLSETAFLVPDGDRYRLRWFTPEAEVDLCGHASLAAGHIVLTELRPELTTAHFDTASGPLSVTATGGGYRLDLPAVRGEPLEPEDPLFRRLSDALGATPEEVRVTARDFYARYAREADVRNLRPDFRALAAIGKDGIGVGAPGDEVELVSRFFAPSLSIDEDPVTGSAHAVWIPWFGERTGTTEFRCRQLSRREGTLDGTLVGDRVHLVGRCFTYLRGTIEV